jgi:Holliday junction resolvase RusA-like endonuclease
MIVCPIYGLIPKKPNSLFNLNFYRNAHFYVLNNIKINFGNLVQEQVDKLEPIDTPVILHYTYYAKRKGTDLDNVLATVQKSLQDVLTKRVLTEDTCDYIVGNTQRFGGYDKTNPRVEVHIEPVTELVKPFYEEPSCC